MNWWTREATAIPASGMQSALAITTPFRSNPAIASISRVATKSSMAASWMNTKGLGVRAEAGVTGLSTIAISVTGIERRRVWLR
jgi:hypothetical protein